MSEKPQDPTQDALAARIRELEAATAEGLAHLAELRALVDAAPIGIFLGRGADCRQMVMNRAGARMLRIPEDINPSKSGPDSPRLPFRVYHQGRELAPEELPMQVAASQGRPVEGFQEELRFDDGEVRHLMTYAAPLHDAQGAVRGCVGTFADVTESRRAERAHRETLERLQLHIDNSPVATVEWDAQTRVLRWSPAAEQIFGWSEPEVLGRTLAELDLIYELDRESVGAVVVDLLDGRVERSRNRNRNRCKDGSIVHCQWYNSVLRDEQGGLISVLSLAMDVTDRHELETSLRAQAERLAEADRHKDELLVMLGHELRNPLTAIANAVLLQDGRPDDPDTARWAHRVVARQTGHLERLVDDLLDVARIERGRIRLERRPLDLCSVVRDTAEANAPLIAERGHRLALDLPTEPLPVEGDETRLAQILCNLIGNAAKYTPAGGLIRVSLDRSDGMAVLAVADNGRGIEPDILHRIFEVFSQGSRTLGRAEGGLGLGLSLVKRLAEMHGGRVEAHSEGPDRGSRFVVHIPLSERQYSAADPGPWADGSPAPAPDPVPAPAPTQAQPQRKRRVLVVDDNADIVESLDMLLGLYGFEVGTAGTGAAALAAVAQIAPDVVLLDIGLPDIDGIEVARRLAALPGRSAMKVVAVSGYGQRVTESRGETGLFDGHLLKPPALDALLRVLE
jgi:PAS domain S-box-containing protein